MPISDSEAIMLVNRAVREAGVRLTDSQRTALKSEVMRRSNLGATAEQLKPLIVQAAKDQGTRKQEAARAASTTGLTALGGPATPVTGAPSPGVPIAPGQAPQATPAQGLAGILEGFLATRPNIADEIYRDPTTGRPDTQSYASALAEWSRDLAEVQTALRTAQQLELGILELPGGVLLDIHDPAVERDPALANQLAALFANQDREVMNAYTSKLNELGLQEYQGAVAATNARNDAMSKGFQDALQRYQTQLATGEAEVARVGKMIDRELQGMQESRARSSEAESQLRDAAGFASPDGRTSFRAQDFGGAVAGLAEIGGVDPGLPLLNFTGTRQVDPLGMMRELDAQLGVGQGPLPQIPGLGVDPAMIPQGPSYGMPGAPPQLIRPQAPVLPQRGAPVAATPPPPSMLQLASVADQMGP